jgi:hypothetical protein
VPYVASIDAPVPPVEVAEIPNCGVPIIEEDAVAPIGKIKVPVAFWLRKVSPCKVMVYPVGALVLTASTCAVVEAVSPSTLVDEAILACEELRVPKNTELENAVDVEERIAKVRD